VRNRSVIEVLVLTFTVIIGVSILGISATILIVEVKDPEVNTSSITQALLTLISGILGSLLGLLAGRSVMSSELSARPQDKDDEQPP
jgi:formate-dependent nitrite reductase membrane component NrfD